MKAIISCAIIAVLGLINCNAQHLSAYTDYMGRFYIFDGGESQKVEDLEVQSFKVGGECILYKNSPGHLMMYHDGQVHKLEAGGVEHYFATDHLAAFSIFEKLKVIYDGELIELSSRCPVYRVADSLIAYYDKNREALEVFYKGEVQEIETGMLGMPVQSLAIGDNLVAYVSSRTKDFKIWHQGESHVIEKFVEDIQFKAGKDIVAYLDPMTQAFEVFYNGEIYEIDNFAPISYKVGDEFVAYVTSMGDFKVFYKGEIIEIGAFEPDAYLAEDKLLVFAEDQYLKVFQDGEVHDVEGFIPSSYKIDWNTLAYLDNSNRIWIFRHGEKKYLSNDFITSFEIYRDLIQMSAKVNRNLIYYQDKFWEGESFYK